MLSRPIHHGGIRLFDLALHNYGTGFWQRFLTSCVQGHQLVHMHDIRLPGGGAVFYMSGVPFGQEQGPPVSVTQLASLVGVCSPDPFTMVKSNYFLTWLSITTALVLSRGPEHLVCSVMTVAQGVLDPLHIFVRALVSRLLWSSASQH